MGKLISSEETKRKYWERKNAKKTNYDKRVDGWERLRKITVNCGSKPMHKDDIRSHRYL